MIYRPALRTLRRGVGRPACAIVPIDFVRCIAGDRARLSQRPYFRDELLSISGYAAIDTSHGERQRRIVTARATA